MLAAVIFVLVFGIVIAFSEITVFEGWPTIASGAYHKIDSAIHNNSNLTHITRSSFITTTGILSI